MTYALSWPLQEALYHALTTDPTCINFFADRIYDAAPPFGPDAVADGLYLILGDEEARDWSTASDDGAEHLIRIDVHAPQSSFAEVKQAAAAVSDVVLDRVIAPSRGHVVNTRFVDAKTGRDESDQLRRIEMRFRIRVEDTA